MEDMQKVPFPICSGDSGGLQAGRRWIFFGRRAAEDARVIKTNMKGRRGFQKKEHCVYVFYEAAQELVGGMLHRHVVQIGGC